MEEWDTDSDAVEAIFMNVDKVVEKVPERFTINPVIDDKKDIVASE